MSLPADGNGVPSPVRPPTDRDPARFRPAVGAMIINARREVFVGQRMDNALDAWQMPQGGIDPGEDARAAVFREVEEETGIVARHLDLIAEAPGEFFYDLPPEMVGKVWKQPWLGQRQRWFLFRFNGLDTNVNIATKHPEFRAWRWVHPAELPALIVPFKTQLYRDVLAAFAGQL